jgi:hypothetical protein
MDSAQHSPSRIIPQRGQVAENTSKPARSEDWGVFHEHVARSHLANDSRLFFPQAASCPVDSFSGAVRGADILTRESARDDIHQSTPRLAVKGSHVVPDWERFEASIVLSGEQHAPGILVNFDGADGSPSTEFAPKYSASSACE